MGFVLAVIVFFVFSVILYPSYKSEVSIFRKFDFLFLFVLIFLVLSRFLALHEVFAGFWPGWSTKIFENTGDTLVFSSKLPWIFFAFGDGNFHIEPVFLLGFCSLFIVWLLFKRRVSIGLDFLNQFSYALFFSYSLLIFFQIITGVNYLYGVIDFFNFGGMLSQLILHFIILLFFLVLKVLSRKNYFTVVLILGWGILGLLANFIDHIFELNWLFARFNYIEVGLFTIIGVIEIMYISLKISLKEPVNYIPQEIINSISAPVKGNRVFADWKSKKK